MKKAKDAAANTGDKAADMYSKVADIIADKAGDVMNETEKLREKPRNIL